MSTPRRTISIEPYDPRWPEEFAAIEQRLRAALGDAAVRVDHIGSTSVPGLAAKDVIDVQIGVADLDDPRLAPALAELGLTGTDITEDHVPPGDTHGPDTWRKRYFRPPGSWRATNVHVRTTDRPNFRYALLFRDYLRAAPGAAEAYGHVKIALARLHPDDVEAYYDVKDPVCDLVMQAAERWADQVGWTVA